MKIKLDSGEMASVEIIPRAEAIDILSRPAIRHTWFGGRYKAPYRVSRGPGGAVDLVTYGLRVGRKYQAVARIGPAQPTRYWQKSLSNLNLRYIQFF